MNSNVAEMHCQDPYALFNLNVAPLNSFFTQLLFEYSCFNTDRTGEAQKHESKYTQILTQCVNFSLVMQRQTLER